jgi:hypothetical protein
MKTNDLSKPLSSTKLNENMFKKFGVRIEFDKYSREELENYRNLLRTKVHQVESKSSFNELLTSETYQKDKYIMGILNQRIKEIVGESKLAERSLTAKEKKKREEIVKAIKRDNPEKRSGKGKSSAYAIATAQAKKTAEGTDMKTTESKKAKKDYDGDGKVETPKDEVWGSRAKAAAKSGKPFEEAAEKTPTTWTDKSGKKHPATRVKGKGYDGSAAEKEAKAKKSKDVDEGLKGGQKALDKDHDNDIDAKDLAALRKGKKKVKESQHKHNIRLVNETLIRLLREDEEGKAKSITAGTDMVNDFTTWMTRVGQYQTKSMIELADAIRANFGAQEAETFKSSVAPALETAINALTQCREEISNAVAVLAGEAPAATPMGDMDMGNPAATDVELEPGMGGDEFGASDAAAGGMEASGREMRESRKLFASKLAESHNLMRTLSK